MWRHAGPLPVRLDIVGDGIQMKCSDLTSLRGSVQLIDGNATNVIVCFKFTCNPTGGGVFIENGTADRISSIGAGAVSSSAVSCVGFAEVRMEVQTATATTGSLAMFEMCSYTPNTAFGEISDSGNQGFGGGVNDRSSASSEQRKNASASRFVAGGGGGTITGFGVSGAGTDDGGILP